MQCIMAVDAEATKAQCDCVIHCYAVENTEGRGSEGCFAAETEIELADGSWIRIGDVKIDMLLRNPVTRNVARVSKVVVGAEPKPLYSLLVGTKPLRVTEYHPFITPTGVIAAKDVVTGTLLLAADGTWKPVASIKVELFTDQFVWNVLLDGEEGDDTTWKNRALNAAGLVSGDLKVQRELQTKLE